MAKATKLVYDAQTKETTEVEFEFTPENPRKFEIQERLQAILIELRETDYKAIKFAEGHYTQEEYQPILEERQALREEYNSLEVELEELE